MRRQRTDPLLVLIIATVLGLVALCFAFWAVPAGAQPAPWRYGPRDEGRIVLWAEGLPAVPAVVIVGGRGGATQPVDDGSGVTWRLTVWCEGCQQILVDEARVWPLVRVALPTVAIPPPPPAPEARQGQP